MENIKKNPIFADKDYIELSKHNYLQLAELIREFELTLLKFDLTIECLDNEDKYFKSELVSLLFEEIFDIMECHSFSLSLFFRCISEGMLFNPEI